MVNNLKKLTIIYIKYRLTYKKSISILNSLKLKITNLINKYKILIITLTIKVKKPKFKNHKIINF